MYARCEHLDPINHVIETYGDLLDLIGRLKTFRDMSLMDIRDEIRGEYGGAAANLDNVCTLIKPREFRQMRSPSVDSLISIIFLATNLQLS